MNRRELLRLMSMGVVGHTLDLDKLLWIPGQKKIFLPPTKSLDINQIVLQELLRLGPQLKDLLERDDLFYKFMKENECHSIDLQKQRFRAGVTIIHPTKQY